MTQNINLRSQINAAFERLKFRPRDRQLDHVERIVGAFLEDDARHVILSAPTGTGKSIIGAAVAETIHAILSPQDRANAAFLLTATNALGQQYFDTFSNPNDPWDPTFRFIKGANNYECSALSTQEEPQTAENCSIRLFQKAGMDSVISENCNRCEFFQNRQLRDKSRFLITNYSYYFTDRMSSNLLAQRSVCVFDEAHLINDLYTEHCAIQFSDVGLQQAAQEVNDHLRLGSTDVFKHLKMIRDHLMQEKIDDKSYMSYLRILADVYTEIFEAAQQEAERSIRQPTQYLKLNRLSKKYAGKVGKIYDLLEHEYPHVFEYKPKNPKFGQDRHEVLVKPIFVSGMFEQLVNAKYNLLMSATISEQYARRTLTLEPASRVKHIRLEPQFPKENKKVIFFKPLSLNYNSMKDPETIKKLSAHTYQIVQKHTSLGERGIVLAPSFAIVESIAGTLRGVLDTRKVAIFEHKKGEKLVDVLDDFRAYKKGPAVFLTPSGFEGLDLPGDLSRFQVVTKAPFGSLGDRRIKVILDSYPDIYSLTCLMKIVQGAGRSVRSSDDHAVTYMLDTGIQRLWTAKNNEWADEFSTSFRSTLSDDE
jgi:ATP-dependent DNA helicase DinG